MLGLGLGLFDVALRGGAAPEPSGWPPEFATSVNIGDSITFGLNASPSTNRWATLIETDLGITVLNKGVSSTTLQNSGYTGGVPTANNGRGRFIADMTGANKQDFAVIAFGTNDARFLLALSAMNAANYKNDMGEMITGLVEAGYALEDILVMPPYWVRDDANFGSGGTRTTYELYVTAARAVAVEYGVWYYDVYAYMRDHGGGSLIDADDPDLIHPNNIGHRAIADGFLTQPRRLNTRARPGAPVVSSPGDGQITVTFDPSAETVVSYTVQIGIESFLHFPHTQDAASPATFTGLPAGTYRARVRANYSGGNSSPWMVSGASQAIASDPSIIVWDSFTDVDGTNLSSHTGEVGATWANITGYAPGTPNKIWNGRTYTPTILGGYKASGVPATADYYVEAVVTFLASVAADSVGICGRVAAAANTMYFGRYGVTAGSWQLFRVVAGVATQIGTPVVAAYPSGDKTLRLSMVGTAIKLFVDGVETVSATDANITDAGFAGLRMTTVQATATGMHVSSIKAVAL